MQQARPRTRIIATLGPATDTDVRVTELIEAGVDVFRLNCSHGSHDEHRERVARIRRLARETSRPVAILADLQGPKIRTGALAGGGPVTLEAGSELRIETREREGDAACVSTTHEALPDDVVPGDAILVSDGKIELRVVETSAGVVRTEVIRGGELRERQGLNLPGVAVSVPSLTEKDEADLAFVLEQEVDWVALSFVRRAQDIRDLHTRIRSAGCETPVIAKIEKPQAVAAIDEILDEVDALMVARGDLGVELSPQKVPLVQKELISLANRRACPVITATQMLESMIESAMPTRAEASDVANAVLDGTDAVMLSGETAVGRHPVAAVRTMVAIAREVEAGSGPLSVRRERSAHGHETDAEAIAHAIASLVEARRGVRAIVVLTHSGSTARLIAAHRVAVPILAFTTERSV